MTASPRAMVKELRDKTGAGMMDCKTALTETKGDMEEAVDWLRKKGLSKAAKKAGRIAAEGLIGVAGQGQVGRHRRGQLRDRLRRPQRRSSRTWCARSPRWRRKANGDLAKLLALPYPGKKVHGRGPRQGDGRHHRREHERAPHGDAVGVSEGVVADYVHNKVADGLGKIGVLVALESKGDKADDWRRSAASSPCTSRPPTRWRSTSPRSSTGADRARARDLRRAGQGQGKPAESSPRWWRAACEGVLRAGRAACCEQSFVPAIDGKTTWSRW